MTKKKEAPAVEPEVQVQEVSAIVAQTKHAFLVCPACGGTAFKYDKSKSGGLIGLECEDPGCGQRIVATPPVVITDAEGHQIQLEFNEGDIVTRQKVRGENEGFATVSIRVPIAVRNRFRYAILVAKKIQGSDERGMYPASVFEYMIEGFLQEHEAEVAPADLEIIRKKVEGEVVPTADPNQTSLPGLDGPGPEDGDPEAGGDPESEGSEFEN